jgi:hypothetical protein
MRKHKKNDPIEGSFFFGSRLSRQTLYKICDLSTNINNNIYILEKINKRMEKRGLMPLLESVIFRNFERDGMCVSPSEVKKLPTTLVRVVGRLLLYKIINLLFLHPSSGFWSKICLMNRSEGHFFRFYWKCINHFQGRFRRERRQIYKFPVRRSSLQV